MKYLKADQRIPYMGLNNKICRNPVYWCRLHEVWLSEEDVKKKNCLNKATFDMIDTKRCSNLENRLGGANCNMRIYFEDGPLRDEVDIPGEILLTRVDAIEGVSANREDLNLYSSYSDHRPTIYTNSIFAFCNRYAWNDELKVPEIYIRHGENDEFVRIDKLTNKTLRFAHNLASMYIAGLFSGGEEEAKIWT